MNIKYMLIYQVKWFESSHQVGQVKETSSWFSWFIEAEVVFVFRVGFYSSIYIVYIV
jgi:hypothetical protein